MKYMLMTIVTSVLLLASTAATASTLRCETSDGDKMTLQSDGSVYSLRLEENNFHFDTLVSKFGYPVNGDSYQLDVTFNSNFCRSNAANPYLVDCGTSVPLQQVITIRNLRTGQVDTKELSQIGQFRSTRQLKEFLFDSNEVRSENSLLVDFVAYSKQFPFVSGGIGRSFKFDMLSCTSQQ